MFFLIRSNQTNEVIGIMSMHEVLTEEDLKGFGECPSFHSSCGCLKTKLERIAGQNVGCDNWYWYWDEITQPEYETYRDLHGFRVFIRPDTDLGYS